MGQVILFFIGLYLLNAVVLISLSGNYISPKTVGMFTIVEIIIMIIVALKNDKGTTTEIKPKPKKVYKTTSTMSAEKFDMFNDLKDNK